MTTADILTILKVDLQISANTLDTYLNNLIGFAQEAIAREGAIIDTSNATTEDGMLVEMYAAYLYRRRREENVEMPRYLRWALNNRIFSEKAAVSE